MVNIELIVELFTVLNFDLNRPKRFKSAEICENICKFFGQEWVIFLREVTFYTQFSITFFIMVKVY